MQGSPSQSDEAYTQHQSDEKEYGRLTAADSPYKLELLDNQKITAWIFFFLVDSNCLCSALTLGFIQRWIKPKKFQYMFWSFCFFNVQYNC